MSAYTDKNIPILCSECIDDHYEDGVQAMFEHILENHPQYNQHEAEVYANLWMEGAYERQDEWEFNQLTPLQKQAYRADQHGH